MAPAYARTSIPAGCGVRRPGNAPAGCRADTELGGGAAVVRSRCINHAAWVTCCRMANDRPRTESARAVRRAQTKRPQVALAPVAALAPVRTIALMGPWTLRFCWL